MAVSNLVYQAGISKIFQGDIILDAAGSDMRVMLIEDSHSPQKNTHNFRDDVSGNHPTGATKADGDLTMAAPGTGTNNVVYFDPTTTSVTFTTVGGTEEIGGVYCFKNSGADASCPLLCLNDFTGGNITANGSDIQVTFNANGIMRVSV